MSETDYINRALHQRIIELEEELAQRDNKERGRPFHYTDVAKTQIEAYGHLIKAQPQAVDVTINNLGEEE